MLHILCSVFCARYFVLALFCASILCWYFVLLFCASILCWYFVLVFCAGILCWYFVLVFCAGILHPIILCTKYFVHLFCASGICAHIPQSQTEHFVEYDAHGL